MSVERSSITRSPGDPPISLTQIAAALPATLDVNDVIVGSLDQSDFPWEDVDLDSRRSAGLRPHRLDARLEPGYLDLQRTRWAGAVRHGCHGDAASRIPVLHAHADPPAPAALNSFTPVAGLDQRTRRSAMGRPGRSSCGTLQTCRPTPTTRCRSARRRGSSSARRRPSPRSRSPTALPQPPAWSAIVDTGDASGDPATALPVEGNVLYLGYVDHADDVDLYGFNSTPSAQVGVRLSHLAGDGDLVVYGPSTDRPGNSPSPVATRTATPSAPPLAAEALDVSGVGYSPEPDTDAGVPVIDGRTVVGRSAARNTDVEAVDAIEPDLLQVSSYNTSTSNLPYVLRVRQVDPPNTPTCTAYARTGGVAGDDAGPHHAAHLTSPPSSSSTSSAWATRSARLPRPT